MIATRASLATWLLAGAVALGTAGCAAHAPLVRTAEPGAPIVAVLPLENLSGRAEYGERFSRLVWTVIGRSGRCRVAEPGEIDAALVEMRIRSSAALTHEQALKLATRLGARWVVAGTLLECGTVRTPEGDLPSFTLALRMLDGRSGEVVWTDLRARTGQDRETVFGWGREESLERLAESTSRDLVDRMLGRTIPDSLQTTEGRP